MKLEVNRQYIAETHGVLRKVKILEISETTVFYEDLDSGHRYRISTDHLGKPPFIIKEVIPELKECLEKEYIAMYRPSEEYDYVKFIEAIDKKVQDNRIMESLIDIGTEGLTTHDRVMLSKVINGEISLDEYHQYVKDVLQEISEEKDNTCDGSGECPLCIEDNNTDEIFTNTDVSEILPDKIFINDGNTVIYECECGDCKNVIVWCRLTNQKITIEDETFTNLLAKF